jgi:hypothetical protein
LRIDNSSVLQQLQVYNAAIFFGALML